MVAAIGEQILAPTDVSLSNWTVHSGCSVVLATHTAGAVSVDGYTLTLAVNPWNIVRTYNPGPRAPLRLPLPVVYMSEADNVHDPLYGSFVGDQGAWSTAKMAEALICMLYRSSVPADCCTSPGIDPPKAPKCSLAIPGGTEKSRRAVLQTPCEGVPRKVPVTPT